MMTRDECLDILHRYRRNDVVVVTTMGCVRPWFALSNSRLDFPSAGSAMGHAADFAMGIALAQPSRQVWALNGDGSMLMSLGTLVTISQTPPPNLVLFVFQNDTFEVTGNQPIPGAGSISMTQIAHGAGFARVHEFREKTVLEEKMPLILKEAGPTFINLRIEPGREPPPKLDYPLSQVAAELRAALREE